MPATVSTEKRRDRGWWVALTLFPFGWGNWAAFLLAGLRANVRRWKLYAAGYAVASIVPWVLDALIAGDDGDTAAGLTLLAGWGFGIVHALVVRPRYVALVNSGLDAAREAAEARLRARREALEIAERDPALAREMGIGRPDRPGAADGGVIDVNSAPPELLERLPGIDAAAALRIVQVRAEVDGFSSLADLGMTLELDGDAVEDLRGRVVFL
jgi:helix-hairpin-helix protein